MNEKALDKKFKITGLVLAAMGLLIFVTVFPVGCDKAKLAENRVKNNLSLAVDIIKAGLSDADPAVRSNAIEAVAATKYMELMPKVQELMADDYVMVRFAAIVAAGDVEYKPADNMVKQLVTVKEENTRIASAYAMTKLGYAGYLDIIREGVASEDETVKPNAIFLIGKAGDKRSLKLLYKVINSQDASDKAQYAAIESVAKLGDEAIFPRLWSKVLSKYADDRIVGIEAMGALGTVTAKDVLVTKLDDEILWVRLVAAEQLARLGNNTGEAEVLRVLGGEYYADMDRQELERTEILTCLAIGQLRTPAVMKYLPEFLAKESKYVRIAAAKAVLQCSM